MTNVAAMRNNKRFLRSVIQLLPLSVELWVGFAVKRTACDRAANSMPGIAIREVKEISRSVRQGGSVPCSHDYHVAGDNVHGGNFIPSRGNSNDNQYRMNNSRRHLSACDECLLLLAACQTCDTME
jgi:hypothetical protein